MEKSRKVLIVISIILALFFVTRPILEIKNIGHREERTSYGVYLVFTGEVFNRGIRTAIGVLLRANVYDEFGHLWQYNYTRIELIPRGSSRAFSIIINFSYTPNYYYEIKIM